MSAPATPSRPNRPEYRNINAFKDLTTYRMPLAALVSILHRISGLIMFLLLPFVLWMFDTSVSSEFSFDRFKSVFNIGAGWLPGWLIKLITLLLLWAFLHHFFAGSLTSIFDHK
jgi:succinate dehydrogenase / fumarate reductase cytochrome b subunit